MQIDLIGIIIIAPYAFQTMENNPRPGFDRKTRVWANFRYPADEMVNACYQSFEINEATIADSHEQDRILPWSALMVEASRETY